MRLFHEMNTGAGACNLDAVAARHVGCCPEIRCRVRMRQRDSTGPRRPRYRRHGLGSPDAVSRDSAVEKLLQMYNCIGFNGNVPSMGRTPLRPCLQQLEQELAEAI